MLSQQQETQSVTEYLAADHRRIDAVIADIGAMIEDNELERADSCFGDLDAALRRHIHIEEEILFPIFEAAVGLSGPTSVMRFEHRKIEGWLDELKGALFESSRPRASTAMAELVQVLEQHNHKEEAVLYPRTDAALSPAERRDLVSRLKG
jgi:iron-sulfur cluster repair protein YtfE (RIC family)